MQINHLRNAQAPKSRFREVPQRIRRAGDTHLQHPGSTVDGTPGTIKKHFANKLREVLFCFWTPRAGAHLEYRSLPWRGLRGRAWVAHLASISALKWVSATRSHRGIAAQLLCRGDSDPRTLNAEYAVSIAAEAEAEAEAETATEAKAKAKAKAKAES
jgi:hypothetical protein